MAQNPERLVESLLLTYLQHALAAVAFGTSGFLFTLLTLRNEVHLLAEGLRNALGDNNLVEAPQELINGFTVTSVNSHSLYVQHGTQ